MKIVALMSPGAMGASVGAALVSTGHEVLYLESGRSERSLERAQAANLTPVKSATEFYNSAKILLSVCPPHLATEVAESAIQNNFSGIYVDANAVSPGKTRQIAGKLQSAEIEFVDGGIIGGPAWRAESNTQLYLSGTGANHIADLFLNSPLHASVINDKIGSASALKMTFAAYSKGTTALLAAILAVAEQEGIRPFLENQWGEKFSSQTEARVTGNATKAWRFKGEMQEIAETFSGAGLPAGFHEAASEVFERLAEYKDIEQPPELTDFLNTLLQNKR